MKMPTLPKMKMPKMPKLPKPQPKRLQATARRAAQPAVDDYDEEPTTRLSSAFVVVLILHVVAVGGIYAFNSIKAHRRGQDVVSAPAPSTPAQQTAAANITQQSAAPAEQPVDTSPAPAPAVAATVTTPAEPAQPPATAVAPISGSRIYHVKSGDTLWRIASVYDVSLEDLAAANGLTLDSTLQLGRALNIPAGKGELKAAAVETRKTETVSARKVESTSKAATTAKAAAPAKASATPKTYTVKKGDNPVAIAKKFNVSYEELLKLNRITDPRRLQIGQVLKLPSKK